MKTVVLFFVLNIAVALGSMSGWHLPGMGSIFDEPIKYFEEKSEQMKDFITTSTGKVKDTFDDQMKQQQRNINVMKTELDSYVESIKQSGRKVRGSWSFIPNEDEKQLLLNPDTVLTVPAIISKNGYNCETHTIISKGYILNIHRIARSKYSTRVSKKTVLLHHGLLASSADWVLNGPEKGLAYVLADAGYDVWMANIRGNRYSREHAWLKKDSHSYWNFSWHDVALYDVPAIIDYILNLKGTNTKITYIGHSMGTTILFAMLTLRPEYNHKLTAGFALAPVVFMSDLKSPVKSLAPIAGSLATMEMIGGSYEFMPKSSAIGSITGACDKENVDTLICKNLAFYICGYNEKQFNKTLMPVFLAHLGTGTSWKTVVHFSQEIVNDGKFQQFDFGFLDNLQIYGNSVPPEYDLSEVVLPIKLFWSVNDLLSSERDVKKLYDELPRKPDVYLVPDPEFSHLDYLWASDAPLLINNEIIKSLRKVMS